MKTMQTQTKARAQRALAALAAGAVALASVAPAMAQDRRHHDREGISAGDVIAGAVILGGIAAVASSVGNNRDRGYDYDYDYGRGGYGDRDHRRGGYGHGYDRGGSPRRAVEQCVNAAESQGSRYSYGRADVTDIRSVRDTRRGYEVRGRIAVNQMGRGWRQGDDRYGRGWGGDYRGWNDRHRGYDSGSFSCRVEYGRVTHLDIDGIRGL
jgi:hypothetical protein